MVQLLLERGVFSEAELLDLLTQCVNAYPDDAKRAKIKLVGDERDKEVLDNVVLREITALLEPLAMKVPEACPGGVRDAWRDGPARILHAAAEC